MGPRILQPPQWSRPRGYSNGIVALALLASLLVWTFDGDVSRLIPLYAIGVFLSFVLYIPRAARVHLTELTLAPERVVRERISSDPVCNRIRIYSLEGELFFGAAPELEEHLNSIMETAKLGVRVVVLRLKRARNPDAVCMAALERFIDRMKAAHVTVLLCGVRPDMMRVLEASGLAGRLGPDRIFAFEMTGTFWTSTLEAVRFAYQIIGEEVCENCPRHGQSLNDKEGWYYLI
jgi:SulP family sulfate permease